MPSSGIPLTTYLDPRDAELLRQRAKAADRSLAGEIRHAIRQHLNSPITSESPAGQPSSRDITSASRSPTMSSLPNTNKMGGTIPTVFIAGPVAGPVTWLP